MAETRNRRLSPLTQAEASNELAYARECGGWAELLGAGCTEEDLRWRAVRVVEAAWRDQPPSGAEVAAAIRDLRRAGAVLERLNGQLAVHQSLAAVPRGDRRSLPDLARDLYRVADDIAQAQPQQAGRRKRALTDAKAMLAAHVLVRTGRLRHAAVAEVLGYLTGNEDYTAEAHKVWLGVHRDLVNRWAEKRPAQR